MSASPTGILSTSVIIKRKNMTIEPLLPIIPTLKQIPSLRTFCNPPTVNYITLHLATLTSILPLSSNKPEYLFREL